jgi:hypothetical protein
LEKTKPPITRQQQNQFTKRDLMKSVLFDSTVLAASRCIGFVTVMTLAALPVVGAGSAKQAVRKDSYPSITIYNQGVEWMLAKRFPEAQARFEQAVKENPRFTEAHNNLRYTLRKQGAASTNACEFATGFLGVTPITTFAVPLGRIDPTRLWACSKDVPPLCHAHPIPC